MVASACTAAIAAWIWNGPTRAWVRVSVTRATPSVIRARFQRLRSCSASGTRPPSGRVRAGPACVGEQHQREQPGDLAVVGQLPSHLADDADGLVGELDPKRVRAAGRDVALVEHQVQHLQHGAEPLCLFGLGHAEAGPGGGDLLFRAADALGHGRLGHEERAGDLRGAQPTDGPQRQRHLRWWGQRGVAAQEQQRQAVIGGSRIGDVGRRSQLRGGFPGGCGRLAPAAGGVAAPLVGQPPRRDGDQPAARAVRHAALGPRDRGVEQGILHGILARVEMAVVAYQRNEHLRCQLAQRGLDVAGAPHARPHISRPATSIAARISTRSHRASGMRAAISAARSRFSQSTR